ncbi:MAG: hypothetical protein OEM64_04940 [Gammaproteobacteria bacterium]|nr:hypothetical protein [Gammaproteobacteria bacterium]MDH3415640.1 hypothetical protein [Gammaproteobacteria bacterium]
MNYLKGLVLGFALIAGHSAMADFKTITRAYEVVLSDFRAPASVNGIVSFKTCESCEVQTVNVSSTTRYQLNDRTVTLPQFRRSLSTVQDRSDETIVVMHHLESDVVTSISISL